MSDLHHQPETAVRDPDKAVFSAPPTEPPRGRLMLVVAGAAVLILVTGIILILHGRSGGARPLNAELPPDPHASSLSFTQLAMSQSTSLSGGTSTFIDGHVRNTGSQTLTGITMQVLFRNDEGLSPRVETLPLSLIRTHEPYVDTMPVSAEPLKPGKDVEFRLIFESIPANWNQQLPELRVVRVTAE